MDQHCRALQKGQLEDLFGIGRPKADPLVASRDGEAVFSRDLRQCKLSGVRLDTTVAEPNLTLAGGEALGVHSGAPVAVVRKTGNGAAVFLNLFMQSYQQRRALGVDDAVMRQVPLNLLRLNDIETPVKVVAEDPRIHMFTVRYANGDAFCVASMREVGEKQPETTAPVALTFPKEGFVYDLRQGKALGRAGSVKAALLPGDAAAYAVLPYSIRGVTVTPVAAASAPGKAVQYSVAIATDGGQPGMHVALVEITGPDGKPRTHYNSRLVLRNGKAAGEFVTALNDTPGQWTIRATDFVSRAAGSAQVQLQP
jgi:hypothetical protein